MANFFANAAEEAKKVPWWGWVLGGGAVLLFGSHLLSQNSASGTASADAAGGDTGGDVGDMGTPGPGDTGQTPGGIHNPPTSSPPPPAGKPPPPTPPKSVNYTVRSGDTLSLIASRYHVDEPALYSTNAGTIEATAKAHGFSSSDNGHWIFPGEILKIPA